MSRFANLEFGDESEQRVQPSAPVKDAAYYLSEGEASFRQGRFEQALRCYSKVLEHDPDCAAAWAGQVRMLIEMGEHREAKLWADKALERFPHDPELLAAKAVALAREGDLKAALAFSDAAVELNGATPYVWLARGDVLLARAEKRADFCFEKAIALGPKDWLWSWLTSRIHYFYRQFSRAFKWAQQALALDAGQAVVWLQLGRCQIALGLAGAADNSLEQARQLDPSCRLEESEINELKESGWIGRLRGLCRKVMGR